MINAMFSAFHILGIMGLAATLSIEIILLKGAPSKEILERLARVDLMYGLSAILVVFTGLARALWYGKEAAFYLHNWVFHLKVGIFVAVALWSIQPTMRFMKWRNACRADGSLPDAAGFASTRRVVFAEVHLLALLPFLAALMARGYGFMGG